MNKYQEVTWKDWIYTLIALLIFIIFLVGASLLLPGTTHEFLYPFVMAASLLILIYWHTRSFAYRCPKCGNEFEISMLKNLISPHWPGRGGGWKLLRCPECRSWSAAKILRISRN